MLRLRGSPRFALLLALLFACARTPDPEPLSSYGAQRLSVLRGTDLHGTPIVYAYLAPPDDDDCAPLARVDARIDGRSLLMNAGGGRRRPCFGPSFQAPIVVLQSGVDFHDLVIADAGAQIRARVADLASEAQLDAVPRGDRVRVGFDRLVRGHVSEAHALWSGALKGDVTIEDDAAFAVVPKEIAVSGRVVLQIDLVVDLEVAECAGVPSCEAHWLVHEVFDVSVTR